MTAMSPSYIVLTLTEEDEMEEMRFFDDYDRAEAFAHDGVGIAAADKCDGYRIYIFKVMRETLVETKATITEINHLD